MYQITVSGMNFNHPEASFTGSTCRLPESCDDPLNFLFGRGLGQGIVIGKSDGARSKDFVPSTLGFSGPIYDLLVRARIFDQKRCVPALPVQGVALPTSRPRKTLLPG